MNTGSILIAGSGAVATLFAARLSAAGTEVKMLATWDQAIAAIRKNGARLTLPDGKEISGRVTITNKPQELKDVQYAIVLVKSWQTERVAHQLKECLAPDGIALTLQNGLGNSEKLAETLGEQRVTSGVVVLGAQLTEPGRALTTGDALIQLRTQDAPGFLEMSLKMAGFRIEKVDNLESLQWGKLIINAAINPLSALLKVNNGNLLSNSHAEKLLIEIAQECEKIAHAKGIILPYPDALEAIKNVITRTFHNASSMLQDRLRGEETEIDAINGSLLRAAEELGMDAPINRCFYHLIQALSCESQTS